MWKIILKEKRHLSKLIYNIFRWHIKFYLFKQNFPLSCAIYVTNQCNLSCSMCSIWKNEEKKVIHENIYYNIIDGLGKLGCYYITHSGGEPFIIPQMLKWLKYCCERIPYVHVVTNGSLLTKEIAIEVQKIGLSEISPSIDGEEDFHDCLRGDVGLYRKVIDAIENLKTYSPKVNIVVNTIIFPDKLEQAKHVIELTSRLKVYIKFQPINFYSCFGTNLSNAERYEKEKLNKREIQEFFKFLKEQPHVLNSRYYLKLIENYFLNDITPRIFKDLCFLGFHHCEVWADGSLHPCLTGMNWFNGVEIKGNFQFAINSSEYKNLLKKLRFCNLCNKCMYVCCLEPRIVFPITNYFRYEILS